MVHQIVMPREDFPLQLGKPLPQAPEHLAKRNVTVQDVMEALVDMGLADECFEEVTSIEQLENAYSCHCATLNVGKIECAGRKLLPGAVVRETHSNLRWIWTLEGSFFKVIKTVRSRIEPLLPKPFPVLARRCGISPLDLCLWMSGKCYPIVRHVDPLRRLEREILCPWVLTNRLRWLLLEARGHACLEIDDEDGLPIEFGFALRIFKHRSILTFDGVVAAIHKDIPRIPDERLAARFASWLKFRGAPFPDEGPIVASLDRILEADGALIRRFKVLERTPNQLAACTSYKPLPPQYEQHWKAIEKVKDPNDVEARIELNITVTDGGVWRSGESETSSRKFVDAAARILQLPLSEGGLGFAPEEISPMLMAMFPKEYFFEADKARRKRLGRDDFDYTSFGCRARLTSLLHDGQLYANSGHHYFHSSLVQSLLPTKVYDPLAPHVIVETLSTLEKRWDQARKEALAAWDEWWTNGTLATDPLGFAKRGRRIFELDVNPLGLLRFLLNEAWTCLPPPDRPHERAIAIRNYLILEVLIGKGLRGRTLRELLIEHFVVNDAGETWANVPRRHFKNRRKWMADISTNLDLIHALALYLDEARPYFKSPLRGKAYFEASPTSVIEEKGPLLLTVHGDPITDAQTLQNAIERATCLLLGNALNGHAFRHFIATGMAAAGYSQRDISEVLLITVRVVQEKYEKKLPNLALRAIENMHAQVLIGTLGVAITL